MILRSYVDPSRRAAAEFVGVDLKVAMSQPSNLFKARTPASTAAKQAQSGALEGVAGKEATRDPLVNDQMYLSQGEHLLSRKVYKPALKYLEIAYEMNPKPKVRREKKAFV